MILTHERTLDKFTHTPLPQPVDVALELWRGRGYHAHSLQDIAHHSAEAALPYPCKEALVVDLWRRLNQHSLAEIDQLPPSNMALRFGAVLAAKIAQLDAYRPALAALYAHSAQEDSPLRPPHGLNDPMLLVYRQVVAGSTDMPSKAEEAEQLAMLFYGLQHVVVLFWLFDRTAQRRATAMLVDFLQEMVRVARPMMMMPIFSKALAKVAHLLQMAFSDETTPPAPSA